MKYLIAFLIGTLSSAAWADLQIINQCNSAGTIYLVGQGDNCKHQIPITAGGSNTIATDNQSCKNYQAYFMSAYDSNGTDGALGAQSCSVSGNSVIFHPGSGGKAPGCTCG